jgi:hypothetical protein
MDTKKQGFFNQPFEGRQLWSIWFVDMDGNEDFLTINLSHPETEQLTEYMNKLKNDDHEISDFTLVKNSAYDLTSAMEYIEDKLEIETQL